MAEVAEHLKSSSVSMKPNWQKTGNQSWFPYYAGFSSNFVKEALVASDANIGTTVLDPWNGAGTTTSMANHIGCNAIGFDINPVTALVAAARLTRTDDAGHSVGLAKHILELASKNNVIVPPGDPLLEWLTPKVVNRFRNIQEIILTIIGTKDGARANLVTAIPPPFASYFLLCLIRTAKMFITLKSNSNPTWSTPERQGRAKLDEFDSNFIKTVYETSIDLECEYKTHCLTNHNNSSVGIADSRNLPIVDNSIDIVITSPPYCTRIDYFRATMFELAALGIDRHGAIYRELRERAMGTNLMRYDHQMNTIKHPRSVQNLLTKISKHVSKNSNSYYLKHYDQYFCDAHLSLLEIKRALKRNGIAILVVQSSYYKEIPVRLGELYSSIGKKIGLDSCVAIKVPVKRVMSSINSRSMRYISARNYTEDVIVFQKQ